MIVCYHSSLINGTLSTRYPTKTKKYFGRMLQPSHFKVVFVRSFFVASPPLKPHCSRTSLLSYKGIFSPFTKMSFYSIILKESKSGIVVDDWREARKWRFLSHSFIKKFNSKMEAEKYITDFNFKIIDIVEGTNYRSDNIRTGANSVKASIRKVKKSFKELHSILKCFPEFSSNIRNRVKCLNFEVCGKLDQIFNITLMESQNISLPGTVSSSFTSGSLALSNPNDKFSTPNPNDIGGNSSNLETGSYDRSLELSDHKDILSIVNFDTTDGDPSNLETGKKLFKFNEKNEVIVFTDGACSNNGKNEASAGAGVWFGNGHPLNLSVKVPGKQTNNNAEIYSVIKAIDIVKATGLSRINIQTDSEFVIKSVKEWMPRWQAKGWKTVSGTEVKNKEMFILLNDQIESLVSISWTHVRGHNGITGNEEADKLAKMAAKI